MSGLPPHCFTVNAKYLKKSKKSAILYKNQNMSPDFKKKYINPLEECETRFERWMFVIRNLNKLDRVPDELRESIFERVFEIAEIAKFTPEEAEAYEDSLKTYRDLNNSIDTAREEGRIEGKEEGIRKKAIEMAKKMKAKGYSPDEIADLTGLTPEEIESIDED
jgi:predicted transposase/invertase (TIGR01784 family)